MKLYPYVNIVQDGFSNAQHRGFKFGSGGVDSTRSLTEETGIPVALGESQVVGSLNVMLKQEPLDGAKPMSFKKSGPLPHFSGTKTELPPNWAGRRLQKIIDDIRFTIKPLPGAPDNWRTRLMKRIAG